MASKKQYWRTLEEYNNPSLTEKLAAKEFPEEIPVEDFLQDGESLNSTATSRRDFLKLLGFSTAAVTLASCEAPIIKSIPYVVKPDSVTPGIPTYYATTLFNGDDYAQVLVKTREGRPIKIEPQKEARYFGSTNARAQASILSLYDNDRIKEPTLNGSPATWSAIDKLVINQLEKTTKGIVILSPSLPSPSTKKIIEEFIAKYPTAKYVVYDTANNSAAIDAAEEVFGKRVLPHYDLTKAKLVVSFAADFLNDWHGGCMVKDYASGRKPGKDMLRHIQVESNLSFTGSNADDRYPVKPSQVYNTLQEVYNIVSGSGSSDKNAIKIAKELQAKAGEAVVFADGSKEAHILAHAINKAINSQVMSGKAIYLEQYNSRDFQQFLQEAQAGEIGTLINFASNPVYSYSYPKTVKDALAKIPFKIGLAEKLDETNSNFKVIAPVPHWLESWGDFQPITGVYALQQPTITRIFDTRQFQDSLLIWMGAAQEVLVPTQTKTATSTTDSTLILAAEAPVKEETKDNYPYYNYLRKYWETTILNKLGGIKFNEALYRGYNEAEETESLVPSAVSLPAQSPVQAGSFELQLYTKPSIGDGTQANNPWLQELPDPITRTSWDNYATMHVEDAEKLGIKTKYGANTYDGRMAFSGSYIQVSANGQAVKVPVFVQPGQAIGSIGIAVGYGRTKGGKVANGVGVNVYPFQLNGKTSVGKVNIALESGTHDFANIQVQNTLLGRYEITRDVNLHDYLSTPVEEWNEQSNISSYKEEHTPVGEIDLWTSFDRADGPHFNLSIDLNSCIGCGACVIACQAENNVPVVGKEEMRRSRDMYWLRIDRYYSNYIGDATIETEERDHKLTQKEALHDGMREPSMYKILRVPAADNPDVSYQPVMCQHCNHAPCETVCPVAATSHGKQGQNMMAYNRCVGTRYCANNCPYKVRRFNWFNYALNDKFDYNMNNDLGRMVLNPDVVVRTRGVMEKCSMCIQKTQQVISQAKAENRNVKVNEFTTACSNACDTGAIQFGDVNNPENEIAKLKQDKRSYVLLEEIGTKPNVFYHVKVRNTDRKI